MTPALLQRLRVATGAIAGRYGKPIKAPIAASVNTNDTLTVSESPPLVIERGQIKIMLSQLTVGSNWHGRTDPADCEVDALAADALAWCTAVAAGQTAALNHNSGVLLYQAGQLSIGVGPGYDGDGSGNLYYGVAVYGPVVITPTALASLTAAIRSMLGVSS